MDESHTDYIGSAIGADGMTARTRLIVRLLDIYADDLGSGTRFEQAVGLLLGDVAAIIAGGDVAGALVAIEGVVKGRADLEEEG